VEHHTHGFLAVADLASVPLAGRAWATIGACCFSHLTRRFAALGHELSLSKPQALMLLHLLPGVPCPQHRLAQRIASDPSNITGVTDRLEARGLVQRHPDPRDRRVKGLTLTADGEAVRSRLAERLLPAPSAFAELSVLDQTRLLELLHQVLGDMEADSREVFAVLDPPNLSSRPVADQAWVALLRLWFGNLRRRVNEAVAEFHLSLTQGRVLLQLRRDTAVPQRDLAAHIPCDPSNLTAVTDRLQARGLAERRPDPRDRRVKGLVLTERGAELQAQLRSALFSAPPAMTRLSELDQAALLELLERTAAGTPAPA
jgi:DNA-binding MarR family transcriptional regulator